MTTEYSQSQRYKENLFGMLAEPARSWIAFIASFRLELFLFGILTLIGVIFSAIFKKHCPRTRRQIKGSGSLLMGNNDFQFYIELGTGMK